MEAIKTRQCIFDAVKAETENARQKFGRTYNSMHEAWAVLKEEVEESHEAQKAIESSVDILWSSIRANLSVYDQVDLLQTMHKDACNLAIESVQIAAVLQKYMDTIKLCQKEE